MPIKGEKLSDLGRYQNAPLRLNGESVKRLDIVKRVVDAVKALVSHAFDEVFNVPIEPEPYTSYCLVEAPMGAELGTTPSRVAQLEDREALLVCTS